MSELQRIPSPSPSSMIQTDGEGAIPRLLDQILKTNSENPTEDLRPQFDCLLKLSVPAITETFLSRSKTPYAVELQALEKQINAMFDKFQLMSNSEHQLIWLTGHLSTLLDLLTLFDETLELGVDEELIGVVDNYKHTAGILRVLYNRPQLSQGDLAQALGLSPSALSNALNRVKDYRLVFADTYGRKKYYTLSANGIRVLRHLEYQEGRNIPDIPTNIIRQLLHIIQKVSRDEISSDRALDEFRQFAKRHSAKSRGELEFLMRDVADSISRKRKREVAYTQIKLGIHYYWKLYKSEQLSNLSDTVCIETIKQASTKNNIGDFGITNILRSIAKKPDNITKAGVYTMPPVPKTNQWRKLHEQRALTG